MDAAVNKLIDHTADGHFLIVRVDDDGVGRISVHETAPDFIIPPGHSVFISVASLGPAPTPLNLVIERVPK